MDRVHRALAPLSRASQRTRLMLTTVGGIVAGVFLIATGWAPLQLLGTVAIVAALLMARGGPRLADAWLGDPRARLEAAWRQARRVTPGWAWPATVAALLVVALAVMVVELLTAGGMDLATLGNFGKGAIALTMIGSLALWNLNGASLRFGRRAAAHRPADDSR